MNRQSYLADESVKRFVDGWLRPRVQGGIPFHHSYTNAQTGQAWRCESLWQAYELYQWNGKNFAENQCELDRLRRAICPHLWAECNVRAAWVLNAVSGEGKFGSLEPKRRLRALEAALFMIGYELPTERRCSREC